MDNTATDKTLNTPDAPNIRRLSRMLVGDGDAARLVAAILHAADAADVRTGLARLSDACLVNGWTVYRWLRGTHEPRRRQRAVLLAEAVRLGLDPDNLPPVPVEVEVPEEDAAAVDTAPVEEEGDDDSPDTLEDVPVPVREQGTEVA